MMKKRCGCGLVCGGATAVESRICVATGTCPSLCLLRNLLDRTVSEVDLFFERFLAHEDIASLVCQLR